MSLKRCPRILATSATAALAIGGLAFAASGSAQAATSSQGATYTCTAPGGVGVDVPATVALSNLPETLSAGVPASNVGYALNLDSTALSGLLGPVVLGANAAVNNVSAQVGTTSVTDSTTNSLLTGLTPGLATSTGTLPTFTPSTTGASLPLPVSFDLTQASLGQPIAGTQIPCTLKTGSASSVTVVRVDGTTTTGAVSVRKQTARVKAHQIGHQKKLLISVKNHSGKASGKVVVRLQGKRVGKGVLKHGQLRMKLKHVVRGVSRVKVFYRGDVITGKAHTFVTVRLPGSHDHGR